MKELKKHPEVLTAAATFSDQHQYLIDLCIQIQQIPAPTDAEGERANWVERYFQHIGVSEVFQDKFHNVYAHIPGKQSTPALMVSAHTDTVFPLDTDLSTRLDPATDRLYGPAIGDNSAGVAGLLALAEKLLQLGPLPVGIWLIANSGEEGLGNLRGMRAAVDRLQSKVGACIVLEGMGLGRIVHQALGSHRLRVVVDAPGGHSWSDFGMASAIHVLVQLASDLSKLTVPNKPRTSFNVGRIWGGTSINTIAQNAALELDMRSEDPDALTALINDALSTVQKYQCPKLEQRGVSVTVETIGDRPTGQIPANHPLVQAASRALVSSNVRAIHNLRMSSTDANIPLSRQIPAVCVGITDGGDAHRLGEWINTALLPMGMRHLLLLTWWAMLWLAGEVS